MFRASIMRYIPVIVLSLTYTAFTEVQDYGTQLADVVKIAQTGDASEENLTFLKTLRDAPTNDVVVRGYAAWAIEELMPRPQDEPGVVYHVVQQDPAADDSNPGTADLPWKTIQKAAETLRAGDTVLIHDGTYREFVRPFLGGTGEDRMITYMAAPDSQPVIKGSDVWQPRWRREGEGLWSAPYVRHAWDHPEEWDKPRPGAMHRCEQIFVDGEHLMHVDTLPGLMQQTDRFFTDDMEGRLWIHLAGELSPAERRVERSMRKQVFAPAVRGLGYIKIKGLKICHGAAPECNGANWDEFPHYGLMSVRSGHHWTIENNIIEWSNAQGLDIGGETFRIFQDQPIVSKEQGWHKLRGNRVNHHGVAGIVGWTRGIKHLLIEDNETSFNALKGNFYQYETAGVKLHGATDCVIRRHQAHSNDTFGIWLDYQCRSNRITQCILSGNMGAGLFHEISPGPLLADNNVILDTRDAQRGGWGDGIYSHDGNHGTYIHNYIWGCRGYGVRLRNLFHRMDRGNPTTTSQNRVWNNFVFNNRRGVFSFNPDMPRAENNHADQNVVWNTATGPDVHMDLGSSGMSWNETAFGKKMGWSGARQQFMTFETWKNTSGEDAGSLELPGELLFSGLTPMQIREKLTRLWPADAPPLDGRYGDVEPRLCAERVGTLYPGLADAVCVRSMVLAPAQRVQIWQTPSGLQALSSGGPTGEPVLVPFEHAELLAPPASLSDSSPTLIAGDAVECPVSRDMTILFSGLDANIKDDVLVVSAPDEAPPGRYGIVLSDGKGWKYQEVSVQAAYELISMAPEHGNHVSVTVQNKRRVPVSCRVAVKLGETSREQDAMLAADDLTVVRVPLDPADAVEADISVKLPGTTLTGKQILSLAGAVQCAGWAEAPTYAIDGFPDGAFPEGVEAFALYQGGLNAHWAARYDEQALHIRVRVNDAQHVQQQSVDQLWNQDSLQLLLKAKEGQSPLALDVALNSDTEEVHVFRCQWPTGKASAELLPEEFSARVVRQGAETVYTVLVPWALLGLDGLPAAQSPVKLSLLVNSNDANGERIGLQWFFGIHGKRGVEEAMGDLWLN